jgi:hypothetical protein
MRLLRFPLADQDLSLALDNRRDHLDHLHIGAHPQRGVNRLFSVRRSPFEPLASGPRFSITCGHQ